MARLVTLAYLLATAALLALSTNLAKVAAGAGLAPLAFLTWSVAGAAAVLWALAWRRRRTPQASRRTLEYFVVAAFLSMAAPNLIFFSAVRHVGAGFVSLAIALPPLLTYLGALLLRLEPLRPGRALGVLLAMAGAGVLALAKLREPGAPVLWIALTLVGPVFLAAGNLYRSMRWPPGAQADTLAPGMLVAGVLLLLPLGALPQLQLALPTPAGPALVLVGAQAATFALQYLLFFELQRRGGPVVLSLLGAVGAVFAVPLAVVLLGEDLPPGLLLGGTLIAAGVALVALGARPPPRAGS